MNFNWPGDIQVHFHNHSFDIAALGMLLVTGWKLAFQKVRGQTSFHWAPGLKHAFSSYIKDLPRFFFQHSEKHHQRCDGKGLALSVALSIQRGRLSDKEHENVIREGLRCNGRAFAKEILLLESKGVLGKFSLSDELRSELLCHKPVQCDPKGRLKK